MTNNVLSALRRAISWGLTEIRYTDIPMIAILLIPPWRFLIRGDWIFFQMYTPRTCAMCRFWSVI